MVIKNIGIAVVALSLITPCIVNAKDTTADVNQDTRAKTSGKNSSTAPVYGAELYSLDRVQFGKFIIRMKMVSEPGVVSSFFTYDNESWQGEGRPWREIDFETIGSKPDVLQTNLITGNAEKRIHSEKTSTVAAIDSFQTYTLEWTPEAIIWKVNGETIRTDLAQDSQQIRDMASTPQTYRANIWISEVVDWVGEFDEKQLPKYQVIDWIEYHEYKADKTFALTWRDDFNEFNDKRWGKGDWGFDTNLATFSPENIKIIDGELVLALTLENTGIDAKHYKNSK
ncbi:MAG: beta-glucanase (GH16 family) [Psychromonas sp.]|jgi:beta-glucanase (GH16 family)|uniref:family 16 glycosylhydrolase n=1 Tax=Psychromonas sp. TaxID=1884585 RepID=UPI0039E6311A